jgi:Metallo-peptidase family M12
MVPISLMRRAVGLAVFLASSLYADPNILKSQVVTLDTRTIERYANSATPFELVLGDIRVHVALRPAAIWPEEGLSVVQVAADGSVREHVVHGNITYEGDVIGEDPAVTEVRFTIAEGALEGYVLTSADWWFVEPLARFDPKAGANQYLVYATRDTDFAVEYGDDGVKADEIYDPPPDPRIPIAMVADLDYLQQSGSLSASITRQTALLNNVSGIYRDHFGRTFKLERTFYDLGEALSSKDAQGLLDQLKGFIRLDQLREYNVKIAHLTTAKNLIGDRTGIGEQTGSRSLAEQTRSCDFKNLMLTAHEIGHNFAADHDAADRWCAVEWQYGCAMWRQTIMWSSFSGSRSIPRFSDGTRDSDNNNVARICGNLSVRGYPCR